MVIALANQKGGVLKTTSTYNLAEVLAEGGEKVLMVDLDPQASLTIATGKEPEGFQKNICDVLKNECPAVEGIVKIRDNLDLIPSSLLLAAIELELAGRTARETILKRSMEQLKNKYAYILIDCPPQLSILTLNALACADEVLIPCKPDYISYRGLEQLEHTIADVKALLNPSIRICGVIATLYEKTIKDHNEVLELIKGQYPVLGVAKKTAEATKGVYSGMPVVVWNPKSEISEQYRSIAKKLSGGNQEV